MHSRKHILFVHAGAELYGADKILLILAAGLVKRGHKVTVAIPWAGDLSPLLEDCGARVLVINHGVLRRKYLSPCGLANRAWLLAKAARTLAKLATEEQVDILHTNTSVVMAGALAATLSAKPHVWHIHEITTRPRLVWRALSWLIPRAASRVACVSEAVLSHLIAGDARNRVKGSVLYNGISPLIATSLDRERIRKELNLTDSDVLVGMIGRVNAWKGQMSFAEAAAKLLRARRNVHFLFVGGTFAGEEYLLDQLRQRISEPDLTGRATVWGFRNDVPAIMSALDIFVLPSIQPDPLPTVVLEAMSLARPVVAYRHGGVCEMVDDQKSGLLATPCNAQEMANAILHLANDASLRLAFGSKGQARFQDHFSVPAFLDAWEHTYAQIVGE